MPCSYHRILFLGQKPIGQQTFARLKKCHDDIKVVGVVSNVSLNVWWGDNEIYRACVEEALPFVSNDRRNNDEILDLVHNQKVTCVITVQHPWILPKSIIDAVHGFAFNLHLAPLPSFKGWYAANHAILQGVKKFGVSIHWVTEEVDSGHLAYAKSVEVRGDDTALTLYRRTENAGLLVFDRLLGDLTAGITPKRQRLQGEHRYYTKDMLGAYREIKTFQDPETVERQVRAMYFPPFEPSYMILANRKVFMVPNYGSF